MTTTEQPSTFTIAVDAADLDDLRARLARVRFPNVRDESDAVGGIPVDVVRALVEHWRHGYDWRAAEAALNRLDHRVVRVRGLRLHAVRYAASGAPAGLPVVLLHGWPDSFLRYRDLAPRLAAAGRDVVVPTLPGYPFSDQPDEPMSVALVADLVHGQLAALGVDRYVAHGGDWGSAVAEQLATAHPEAVAALHLADVPYQHLFEVDRADASEAEVACLDAVGRWAERASYFTVQSVDPTTLAYGLADSPVGLLAWVADKHRAWTDREPDADALLTQVSLFWFENAIRSTMRLYAEGMGDWGADDGDWGVAGPLVTPTAIAQFPADISRPPRELAERFFTVRRFTVMPAGGHFGAADEPEALATDILGFLADEAL